MSHYTHINRTKHKQSSESHCIRFHRQHCRASLNSPYRCSSLSFPPDSLFISLSVKHSQHACAQEQNCNFWKWKWKLAPIRETNKETSVLYVCQVVEGIQIESVELHSAFMVISQIASSWCFTPHLSLPVQQRDITQNRFCLMFFV